ncbi:PhaM family polyhydroxyalkanoate granule multifunctional regulatory protein [Roseateles sp. SL47]|uniref:PhaM family polyhydroxyalkanoate granule multifunctional regulatory protein n=1 Tax=Roseateles sp. SL47 TaxID=2995138 RepID=UPI002D1E4128|nr:PhaM family polyhydroxyalkanoate granule multifunctional regulatory protein [Roseateles sp. SL47]
MSDSSFGAFVPGFDFLQGLVKNAGAAIPGFNQWVAPTLNPQELEKRIQELRAVQFWLEQNARMLATTVQALEVQKMTLSTLSAMNVPMADLKQALKMPPMPDFGAAMNAMRQAAAGTGGASGSGTDTGAGTSPGATFSASAGRSAGSSAASSSAWSAAPGPSGSAGSASPSSSSAGASWPVNFPFNTSRSATPPPDSSAAHRVSGGQSDDGDPQDADDPRDAPDPQDADDPMDAADSEALDTAELDGDGQGQDTAKGPGGSDPSTGKAPKAAPLGVDPMQWWNALTQQFTQIATQAMKDTHLVKQGLDAAGESLRKAAAMPGEMMSQAATVAKAATAAAAATVGQTGKAGKGLAGSRPSAATQGGGAGAVAGTRSPRALKGRDQGGKQGAHAGQDAPASTTSRGRTASGRAPSAPSAPSGSSKSSNSSESSKQSKRSKSSQQSQPSGVPGSKTTAKAKALPGPLASGARPRAPGSATSARQSSAGPVGVRASGAKAPANPPAQTPTTASAKANAKAPANAPAAASTRAPAIASTTASTKAPAQAPAKAPAKASAKAPTKAPVTSPTKTPAAARSPGTGRRSP